MLNILSREYGLAVDQGKTSNLNALSLLASSLSKSPGEVGTTTYRPNFIPVTMGAISGNRKGELYIPTRHLSAHNWHHDRGAVFDDYGGWRRPAYYGKERDSSILKEVDLVRHAVGLFDASPLGKIVAKPAVVQPTPAPASVLTSHAPLL